MTFKGSFTSRRPSRFVPALHSLLIALTILWLIPTACLQHQGVSPVPAEVRPDPVFNHLFTRSDHGWTGGDGTLSIALPDGRSLWLFGDSFLGHVRPDGSRPVDTPLIRNCLVVQEGENLVTLHRGTRRDPRAFLTPEDPQDWYWPGDGTVIGNRLHVFFHRFRQVSPGIWGWAWDGTVIATLGLPGLGLERVTPAEDDNGVAYGSALLEAEPWIYIFGTKTQGAIKQLHLARAPEGNLLAPWQYWDGRHWSYDAGTTRSLLTGVSNQFGVLFLAKGIGLVTMDDRQPFSDRLVLYVAPEPTGPWQGPIAIYRAPEADGNLAAYNPFVHTQFSHDNEALISYNINHVHDPDRLYENADFYRPRFIRADLERLASEYWKPDP